MVLVVLYGLLAYFVCRRLAYRRRWAWVFVTVVVTIMLVGAIGLSRVYLGVYYASDVVAGYLAGAIWLAFVIAAIALAGRSGRCCRRLTR